MPGSGFDRDEPPRGARMWRPPAAFTSLGFYGVKLLRFRFASGIDACRVETRYAARREARKPAPAAQAAGTPGQRVRPAIMLFPALNYRFLRLRRKL